MRGKHTASFGASLVLMVGLLLSAAGASARTHHRRAELNRPAPQHSAAPPVPNALIFVHGYDGSGSQFESQKMRFTSNGYPDDHVTVFEYDSSQFSGFIASGSVPPQQEAPLFAQLDQLVAHMKAVTHRPQVDLAAHSLGTLLMHDYLNSSPQRAASVAHYINIDGQASSSPPGHVPTLALWATKGPLSPPGRSIGGATNVSIPDSTHVQCATSPVSFYWMYKFLTGKPPRVTDPIRQTGPISVSGRAVNFPQNTGLSGATVQVWTINQTTGQRAGGTPIASFSVGSTGDWGPVTVQAGQRYEFAELRPGAPVHHFYYEPFVRDDHLIRLLESDALRLAGGPPDPLSVAMVLIRYKELWGDQGSENDVLTVNGLNVCNPNTCPLSKEVNGLFAADFDHDRQLDSGETWPGYQSVGYFVSSSDVFAPASPPAGEVTIGLKSRGQGPVRTLSFPNFPGTTDVVTVQLNDFEQTAAAPPPAPPRRPKCTTRRRHGKHGAGCRHRT